MSDMVNVIMELLCVNWSCRYWIMPKLFLRRIFIFTL